MLIKSQPSWSAHAHLNTNIPVKRWELCRLGWIKCTIKRKTSNGVCFMFELCVIFVVANYQFENWTLNDVLGLVAYDALCLNSLHSLLTRSSSWLTQKVVNLRRTVLSKNCVVLLAMSFSFPFNWFLHSYVHSHVLVRTYENIIQCGPTKSIWVSSNYSSSSLESMRVVLWL